MDELTIGEKTYVSSKRAAELTGYAKDYVGQLCREGRVEARLVGRSWYVLESSIRDHRFGNETESDPKEQIIEKKPVLSAWSEPTYGHETQDPLPELLRRPEDVKQELSVPLESIKHSETLTEMRDAWKEWFNQKEELLLESSTTEEQSSSESSVFEHEETEVAPAEIPVSITRIEEPETPSAPVIEDKYVPVPVVRVAPTVPRSLPHSRLRPSVKQRPVRVERESAHVIVKSALIAFAGIAVAITMIGSGLADTYLNTSTVKIGLVDFLGGQSEYVRVK